MSQGIGQAELKQKTQQLLDGPLKHIRAVAIAAALLPLASVTPASAQPATCGSGGVCGVVFNDINPNGIQEPGEIGIPGAKVTITVGANSFDTYTDSDGFYFFGPGVVPGGSSFQVAVLIGDALQGFQASPPNVGPDDTVDSDGVVINGFSVATGTLTNFSNSDTDFGFHASAALNPGTGTPGYWKNHLDAWPVSKITVGGIEYTPAQAIIVLGKVGKDKTTTIFASLISAKLNVIIDNESSCVAKEIGLADAWLSKHLRDPEAVADMVERMP
jgi:hypothetical protein